jgi:Stage II sporulation protein E (SpoIIE)
MLKPIRVSIFLSLLVTAALAPVTLVAQSIVNVPPRQCVWHSGDDISWAAPALDESGWLAFPVANLKPGDAHLWVRCHAGLSPLRGAAHPSVQVSFHDAYQLFVNGQPMGAAGNLRTGNFSMNSIRSFPLPGPMSDPPPQTAVIALRVTHRYVVLSDPTSLPPLAIQVGDESGLRDRRAAILLAQSSERLMTAIYDGIVGVFGFILLGLYFNDRSRRDLLLLGLNCLGLATIFLNLEAGLALLDYPAVAFVAIYTLGTVVSGVAQPWFFFSVARRRVPLLFWLVIAAAIQDHVLWAPAAFLPVATDLQLAAFYARWAAPLGFAARVVAAFAPFIAFWPYSTITRRVRPLVAMLCMVWGLQSALYFFVRLTIFHVFGIPNLAPVWGNTMSAIEPIMTLCVIAALMWLLFREQRQLADERAEMAGEMQAARRVQQYLIPAQLPATPGFAIASDYRPAREVGGDFFQVLPQPEDGSLLVVVGDVAGKGMEAGMLAALIVGAIRTSAEFTTEPDRILSLLNHRLQGRGLVTCLALRIAPTGAATLANAGHLPPYLNGNELPVEGALPLGAVPGIQFPPSHFTLAPGDSLLLMTDGVVEAQDAEGRLFGFERIGELLHGGTTGAALALAAQNFGQQDDITVLTLTRLSAVSSSATVAPQKPLPSPA